MSSMFEEAAVYDQFLGNWNLSSTVDMSKMFKNAKAYNSYVSGMNVTTIKHMNSMFQGAAKYNQWTAFDPGDAKGPENVIDIGSMFEVRLRKSSRQITLTWFD